MARRYGWRPTGHKRIHLVPRGLRWLADVWINVGAPQLRGRWPSVSVKVLRLVTWNARSRRLSIDGPGILNVAKTYPPGQEPTRLIAALLTLAGVPVVAVVTGVVAVAWQAVQAVVR